MLLDDNGVDHFFQPRVEVPETQRKSEVADWPPFIFRNQIQQLCSLRRESSHAEIRAHHDQRQVRTRQEVGEVVIDLSEELIALTHLLVQPGQLVVAGLSLLS